MRKNCKNFVCNDCRGTVYGWSYHCDQDSYDLCLPCAKKAHKPSSSAASASASKVGV